ncbi:MAG: multicomponent Na+:H+ antiporter subunit [Clostridiales bacterium]|uniref:Cation antiporter n=1 Tax=Mahella australiensis (strain DSM 15567 / CIP 107919 / 50-1 BON) TaxID=697281 RepID=F4A1E9_MAHA5|nr:Na+/H+ antiporter subunit E [Mahella australiensis]AEE97068.1 cation antiporter [Mahella australiensis 50-1 BON]MDK2991711.1 multicomponent Na+:H+ antiporter subunit [Clostridiales bacterium]
MRRFLYYRRIILILLVFWVILVEEISFKQILAGMIVGVLTIIFTNNYLLLGDYEHFYSLKLWTVVKFITYLMLEIYRAGIISIYRIIKNETNVYIIDMETKLERDFTIGILANSITLTPGTVTLDKNGKKLKVLCLGNSRNQNLHDVTKLKFEDILSEA